MGLSRDELMRRLRRCPATGLEAPENLEIASAALGIDPVARGIILGQLDASTPWKYWGYANRPDAQWATKEFENVRRLLDRTGLELGDLLELLATHYINPEVTPGDRAVKFNTAASTDACDLAQMKLAPIDVPFLTRFHRFARLWRRIGLTVREVDRAIAIFGANDIKESVLVGIADARRVATRLPPARPRSTRRSFRIASASPRTTAATWRRHSRESHARTC
jgi:hypothetical protein